MTEDPSFWDWLWFTALDGIGGGLLGGVIAWLLLRRTIKHETELRSGDREAAEVDGLTLLLGEVRERAARVMLWMGANKREDFDGPGFADRIAGLYSAILGAQAVAERIAPRLGTNLQALSRALAHATSEAGQLDVVRKVCSRAVAHATVWVASPERYEANAHPLDLVGQAGSGDTAESDSA